MITPRFNLSQDSDQLRIQIFAPFTSVKNTEIFVEEDDFRFFSSPYYLRLHLPGKVQETDSSSARYDTDGGFYEILLDKTNPGDTFPNLDMLTSFLIPKGHGGQANFRPSIEVLSSTSNDQEEDSDIIEGDEWYISQVMEEEPSTSLLNQYKYGFANSYSGLGSKYEGELGETSEIRGPDNQSPTDRRKARESREIDKFSDDHYLGDLINIGDDLTQVIHYKLKSFDKLNKSDQEMLKNLPNKEFLLDKVWLKRVSLSLIDILYAFALDLRIRCGEPCIETAWNISHLSSTLSWFDVFDTVHEVVRACIRRSLCYPLYRNWRISLAAFQDTINLLKSGSVGVLKCLLIIMKEFNKRDPYYLLNQLYIQDYIIWVQSKHSTCLISLIPALEKAVSEISKGQLDLDLEELEVAAQVVQEEEMEAEISSSIQQVQI